MEKKRAIFRRTVLRKVTGERPKRLSDSIVAEEPFTVVWESQDGKAERLASTMRTPGDDLALAAGMLFSEGLVRDKEELSIMSFCAGGGVNELNKLKAELRLTAEQIEGRLQHKPSQSTPQSACGMCGLDDLSSPNSLLIWSAARYSGNSYEPSLELLDKSRELLRVRCPLFERTGASHGCVVISSDAEALSVGEDVGRHNACDKAIGRLFLESRSEFQLPKGSGILFSSRLSFELASKALAAGVGWMASVGAPTHLAVELAAKCGVPLIGFLTKARHNLYTTI